MGDPHGCRPHFEVGHDDSPAVLVEPANALSRHGMKQFLLGGHEPELVADLEPLLHPSVDIKEVVGDEIGLFRDILGPRDGRRKRLGEFPDVAKAIDVALEGHRLRGGLGADGWGSFFGAADHGRALFEQILLAFHGRSRGGSLRPRSGRNEEKRRESREARNP